MAFDDHEMKAQADLAPFTHDVAEHLDQLVAKARPVPDFAAMMVRARTLDIAEGSADPPLALVIPLARRAEVASDDKDAADCAALAPFTAALRAELDTKARARSLTDIPPRIPAQAPPRRGRSVVLGLFAAAAVLVLFAIGPGRARPGEHGGHGVEANAVRSIDPQGVARQGSPVRPRGERATVAPGSTSELPVPVDNLAVISEPEPTGMSTSTPDAVPTPKRHSPPNQRAVVDAAKPQVLLEDEAQALWERGELGAAEHKLREVLKVAGNGRRAELAYGDLFALARQMRGADGQVVVWREYLDRFPRGQFADDARAGLCQRERASERAVCWRDYLVHHPDGSHRKQAEAQSSGSGAP